MVGTERYCVGLVLGRGNVWLFMHETLRTVHRLFILRAGSRLLALNMPRSV